MITLDHLSFGARKGIVSREEQRLHAFASFIQNEKRQIFSYGNQSDINRIIVELA